LGAAQKNIGVLVRALNFGTAWKNVGVLVHVLKFGTAQKNVGVLLRALNFGTTWKSIGVRLHALSFGATRKNVGVWVQVRTLNLELHSVHTYNKVHVVCTTILMACVVCAVLVEHRGFLLVRAKCGYILSCDNLVNGARLLFLSLYLRLRSTVSRHPKVVKRWRREKRQPSAKETKEDFFVGVVWLPTVPG
jgi:hypothetical protein